jgi:hypothetical protein
MNVLEPAFICGCPVVLFDEIELEKMVTNELIMNIVLIHMIDTMRFTSILQILKRIWAFLIHAITIFHVWRCTITIRQFGELPL